MASWSASQLFLLADHIKLSLLERQRAVALNIPANSQNSQIARSLDDLDTGIRALEFAAVDASDTNQLSQLRVQYQALNAQHQASATTQPAAQKMLTTANEPALQADFAAAQSIKKQNKSVRFTGDSVDQPNDASRASRAALFRYRDNPDEDDEVDETSLMNQSSLSNQQIHEHHRSVLAEQDEQLDRLGLSLGRQRDLGLAIGNELDEQVMLLHDVEQGVDRHQGQLGSANRRLNTFAHTARQNWGMTTIIVLVLILVMLIVITK